MQAGSAISQVTDVNAGARLDRLPICAFHWRILGLIGAGMFLDAFDIYRAGGVLGAVLKEGWCTLQLNATFVSTTFMGMTLGAWFSGILGDRFGRRFTYQVNLAIFGLASIAAAFAPSMTVLIACGFIIGIGLGTEIVVGYATLTEFVPASSRGRWIGLLAVITNFSLFASSSTPQLPAHIPALSLVGMPKALHPLPGTGDALRPYRLPIFGILCHAGRMIVIGTGLVEGYLANHAGHKGIRAARSQYEAWLDIVGHVRWRNPEDIKASYPKASILKASRVVFNIKGNDYRLVAALQYRAGALATRFFGTQKEYDRIDAETV